MHVYIYDGFLNQRKFDNILAKIETRITDLGLNGKIVRLGLLKNISGAVDDEVRRGSKTIIAVGNNLTLHQIINSVLNSDSQNAKNIPIMIIPIGPDNEIASYLGINSWEDACDTMSARRIEKINVGKANNLFFLSEISIDGNGTKLEINADYSIEAIRAAKIKVLNFPLDQNSVPQTADINPQDTRLKLLINSSRKGLVSKYKNSDQSIFGFEKLTIFNQSLLANIDNSIKIKTPIEVFPTNLFVNFIVGKNRCF